MQPTLECEPYGTIVEPEPPGAGKSRGWINGFIGVLIFSGSLPATRLAVLEFDPVFLTVLRAAIAGAVAVALLWLLRERRPAPDQWLSLFIVAMGVVLGFPLLTALALQHVTSAHSIVFVGLLPLATAIFAVLRAANVRARCSGCSLFWAAHWWSASRWHKA